MNKEKKKRPSFRAKEAMQSKKGGRRGILRDHGYVSLRIPCPHKLRRSEAWSQHGRSIRHGHNVEESRVRGG